MLVWKVKRDAWHYWYASNLSGKEMIELGKCNRCNVVVICECGVTYIGVVLLTFHYWSTCHKVQLSWGDPSVVWWSERCRHVVVVLSVVGLVCFPAIAGDGVQFPHFGGSALFCLCLDSLTMLQFPLSLLTAIDL